mmetsp:Transcript_39992/g.48752  ORF Transcript_39992/g.48752 Transcript_39992/m.48752 type:complete len:92 (+) Transcript_39992:144-419(+)
MSTCTRRITTTAALAASLVGSGASVIPGVPDRMLLSSSMKDADLDNIKLIKLAIDKDKKTVHETDLLLSREAIAQHKSKHGSLCFVVRRPG